MLDTQETRHECMLKITTMFYTQQKESRIRAF